MIGTIVWAVVGGTILGYIGNLLLPGRQDIPAWATIGAGIAAALIGGVIATWLGVGDTAGIDWWLRAIQIVVAVAAIWAVAQFYGTRGRGTDAPGTPPTTERWRRTGRPWLAVRLGSGREPSRLFVSRLAWSSSGT